jgi:hypothetical protein
MSMRKTIAFAAVTFAFVAGFAAHRLQDPVSSLHAQSSARVYELRTYTAAPGKFDALNTRFRDHTVRLFAKHGVKDITYLTPTEGPLMGNTIVYVIPHASRDAAKAFWAAFLADPEWVKAKAASEVNGPLTTKVEALWLKATDYSAMK